MEIATIIHSNQINQLKAILSGLHLQPKLVVTERSAPDFTTADFSTGYVESIAKCNSDEAVTGGGYLRNLEHVYSQDEHIAKNAASGNGWSVVAAASSFSFKAVAECAKLS
jgi:hypothetical protein